MAQKLNGAQAFFKTLVDGGIDTVFGCPGTSEMQIIEELGRTDLHCVLGLQENIVTGMADGYGRMAGKPSLALLHVGSGISNGLAHMQNARRASSPMIVFAGGVAANHEVNNPEHQMNERPHKIATAGCDWVREALTSDLLSDAAAQALQVATQGPGKVAMVFGPAQTFWEEATIFTDPLPPIPARRVSKTTIDGIAESLKAGKKTAILLGGLALREDAIEMAGRIAEGTGASLWHDYIVPRWSRGAGTVRLNQIPYVVEQGVAALAEFEQIVLVGNQIPIPTFSYKGKPLTKVPAGCEIKTLATIDCDILAALTDLAKAVKAPAKATDRYQQGQFDAPTGTLTPSAMEQCYGALIPENAIFVDDSQLEGFGFVKSTEGAPRHDYLMSCTGGAIGSGVSMAAGAAVACPDRQVICLEGDFSFMLGPQALWSMANQNANVCIVNYNNHGSASLEMELARVRPGDASEKSMDMLTIRKPLIDYLQLAASMGVKATRASTAEEFHEQFSEAMANKGPHLIDAQIESTAPATIKLIRDNLVL